MTSETAAANRPLDRARSERSFFTGMALLMMVLVLVGFAPSFYFKGLVHYPRPNPILSPFVMAHGIAFSLWILLFVAQTSLVAAGRRELHRALGIGALVYAMALMPMMYLVSVWQVARANQPPFTDPLTWTVMPLLSLPFYVAMLWLGWRHRSTPQTHKRFMLGFMIMLMEPAVTRFPIAPPTIVGHTALCVLTWLLFVPLFVWDRRTLGKVHWASRTGAALFAILIAGQTAFLVFPGAWEAFAARLPGVGG